MKLGKLKIFILIFFLSNHLSVFAEDKIESVPLINLEELSPTFEEDKDELEKIEQNNNDFSNTKKTLKNLKKKKIIRFI